jgi:alkylhydroperoxidase family enzyme
VERLPHLRAWREYQSFGLREVARMADLNQATLYNIEVLGRPAQPRTVRTLAKALGITVQQLRQAPPAGNEVGPRS